MYTVLVKPVVSATHLNHGYRTSDFSDVVEILVHQFPWEHESCFSDVPTLEALEHSVTGQAEYVWTTVACASGTVVNLRSTPMM